MLLFYQDHEFMNICDCDLDFFFHILSVKRSSDSVSHPSFNSSYNPHENIDWIEWNFSHHSLNQYSSIMSGELNVYSQFGTYLK